MTEHLDLDALTDLLAEAGEGGNDAERSARGHLSTCAACADQLREVEAAQTLVTASLASLPAPVMPPEVAARLTAALAAEPAVAPRAAPSAAPSATATATVTPLDRRRRTPRAWLPAVAASVVLVGGGLLGYSLLADPRGDEPNATAALDSSAERNSALVRSASGLDYADAAAVASALPGVLTGTVGESARSKAAGPTPAAPAPAPPADAGAAQSAADPLDRLRDPAGLASCLVALLPPEEPDVRPLALDYARYEGAPALAVVLPDPDPTKVSIFVVGPDCSQADDDTLFFTRLDRP